MSLSDKIAESVNEGRGNVSGRPAPLTNMSLQQVKDIARVEISPEFADAINKIHRIEQSSNYFDYVVKMNDDKLETIRIKVVLTTKGQLVINVDQK